MTITTHCQICGRAIRTVRGLIVLHGHSRPHRGVQTQSCLGAHFRPYELANDALPPAITRLERCIAATEAKLAAWAAHPPAEIVLPAARDGIPGPQPQRTKLSRPEGFDPASAASQAAPWESYERAYRRIQEERRAALEVACEEADTLRRRLAGWVPPVEIAGRFVARAAELRRSRYPRRIAGADVPTGDPPRGAAAAAAAAAARSRREKPGMVAPGTVTIMLTPAQVRALEHIVAAARGKAARELERLGLPKADALNRLREAWAAYGDQAADLLDLLSSATLALPGGPDAGVFVAEPGGNAADVV